ncbi:unnamed protein product [Boreogadus saida]
MERPREEPPEREDTGRGSSPAIQPRGPARATRARDSGRANADLPRGVIVLFCRQYDIIKDNEPNTNKDKAKNSSECSTPEHPQGGLLRSNV